MNYLPGEEIFKPRPNDRNMPTQHIATVLGARNMLRAFGHRVAICCDMLDVVGSSVKMVKFEQTTPNTSQHVATRRNRVAKCTQHVAFACCDRLAGALEEDVN